MSYEKMLKNRYMTFPSIKWLDVGLKVRSMSLENEI